jgi:hypothetical protein
MLTLKCTGCPGVGVCVQSTSPLSRSLQSHCRLGPWLKQRGMPVSTALACSPCLLPLPAAPACRPCLQPLPADLASCCMQPLHADLAGSPCLHAPACSACLQPFKLSVALACCSAAPACSACLQPFILSAALACSPCLQPLPGSQLVGHLHCKCHFQILPVC